MAIQIICPGCHTQFKVSDKFAGKKGPCPKCKVEIEIPESDDEVKIHGPETFGPKGKTRQPALKPIFRKDAEFSLKIAGIIAGAVLLIVILAAMFGSTLAADDDPAFENQHTKRLVILTLGAIIVAPPVVFAGYTFLRDQELEAYRGKALWTRVAICGAVYAALWALVAIVHDQAFAGEGFPMPMVIGLASVMILLGAGAAFVCLDFDFTNGLFHYGLYFACCVLLRLIVLGNVFSLEQP